jgi:hypothetical protein
MDISAKQQCNEQLSSEIRPVWNCGMLKCKLDPRILHSLVDQQQYLQNALVKMAEYRGIRATPMGGALCVSLPGQEVFTPVHTIQ